MKTEIVDAQIAGNRVKERLTRVGMSQEEAARRLNVSYRHFNRITLGQTEPTMLLAMKMERVLGCKMSTLFDVTIETRRTRKTKSKPRKSEE